MAGDITEDHGDVVYIGVFAPLTDETDAENCLIRRIVREVDEETGVETTRITYPDGDNAHPIYTWADRANYNYKYAKSK